MATISGIFEDFSATQILREIDFGHLLGSKYAENGYILHSKQIDGFSVTSYFREINFGNLE